MNTRWFILLPALFGVSCNTNMNSSLVVSKMVLGTLTTLPGPPITSFCSYDPSAQEFDFAQIDPTANTGGTMGVVVDNNLTDTTTLNQILRTNSATFHPHQAVADYEVIGGSTVTLDVTVIRSAGGWFASDTSCTGQDPGTTSIYSAMPPACGA